MAEENMHSNSNLIVNYVPVTYNEEQLKELFGSYGTITGVKLIIDKATSKSLGYGFVKFSTDEEAQSAIDGLNGRQIENKTLKVAIAKPPGAEKNSNLYIAGLEPHVTKEDLQTLFESYGVVLESKILTDRATGSPKGIGFIKFENPQDAESAIKALNGVTLAGTSKPLTVRVAEKKDNKMTPMANSFGRNMRFNPMTSFNPYQNPYAAMNPYAQAFPGYQQQQQQQQQQPNTPSFCLFVYNLPPESDEGYLYQLFGPYGAVANVKIVREPGSTFCKGFGFVNMVKYEDAQSAINSLHGAQIGPKTLQVSFKKDGK